MFTPFDEKMMRLALDEARLAKSAGDIAVGAVIVTEKEFEYNIKVTGEEQANRLLGLLISNGITIITFDLREPSLHEIFVEKVGEVHEAE